jgi:hypothetical protein
LLEAQRSKSGLPYVKVQVSNRVAGITRLDWERLYQGSEPDSHHAATMPGDGSLVRLRTASPGGALYRQRVTSPGPESDFSSWTEWEAAGGAWLSGYGYRKQITIDGTAAGAQTNYQMKLIVHKGFGSDSGDDVYLGGHCRDDFNDIRFTKSDGETELDHWRESYVSGDYAVFWIEFDSVPASPDSANFYIYYGKADASSGSNFANTFVWCDDFEDGDVGDWSTVSGKSPLIVTAAQAHQGTYALSCNGAVRAGYKDRGSNQGVSRLMGWVYDAGGGSGPSYSLLHINTAVPSGIMVLMAASDVYSTSHYIYRIGGSWYTSTVARSVGWHCFEFRILSDRIKGYVDGAEIFDTASYNNWRYVMFGNYWDSSGLYGDSFCQTKFCDPEPTWGDWGSEETPEAGTYAVALCSREAEVLAFRIGINGHLYRCESSDNGASWGSWIDMGAITGTASNFIVAACYKGNGDAMVLYANGAILYWRRRISGSWESAVEWTNSLQSISGVSVFYEGDWNTIITGVDPSNQKGVWTCVCGDGYSQSPGIWSALAELSIASAGSNVEFMFPSISFPDVFRTFFIERYSGVSSYSRPFWSHSLASAEFISNLWREPVPFDLYSSYGLALTYHGSYAWLSAPFGVWRAPLSLSAVDVTGDVIVLNFSAEPFSGKARIELGNDDGRYGDIGTGSYAAICQGSQVSISPGYRTSAGLEASSGPACWIEGWEYISKGAQAVFVLHAADGWRLLEHWKARRQFSWSAGSKNVFQLLAFIFARAGLEFSAFSNSEEMVNHYPAFAIHPGESGASAVRELLKMVPNVLFFRGHYGYIKNPKATDSSSYSYGVDHALWQGRYSQLSPGIDRVQVFGDGVLSEGFDWPGMAKVYDRLHQVHDLNLDTVEKAQKRAQAELRRQEIAASDGEILVPPNCGQELYDVIDVTDSRAGLEEEKRRVLGLTLRYSAEDGRYEQRLELGGM